MSQTNDCKRSWLSSEGYVGQIGDMWYDWLIDEGYTGDIEDMEYDWLGDLGYTGDIMDRWFDYLRDLGATGKISDMFKQFWCGENGVGPGPATYFLDARFDSYQGVLDQSLVTSQIMARQQGVQTGLLQAYNLTAGTMSITGGTVVQNKVAGGGMGMASPIPFNGARGNWIKVKTTSPTPSAFSVGFYDSASMESDQMAVAVRRTSGAAVRLAIDNVLQPILLTGVNGDFEAVVIFDGTDTYHCYSRDSTDTWIYLGTGVPAGVGLHPGQQAVDNDTAHSIDRFDAGLDASQILDGETAAAGEASSMSSRLDNLSGEVISAQFESTGANNDTLDLVGSNELHDDYPANGQGLIRTGALRFNSPAGTLRLAGGVSAPLSNVVSGDNLTELANTALETGYTAVARTFRSAVSQADNPVAMVDTVNPTYVPTNVVYGITHPGGTGTRFDVSNGTVFVEQVLLPTEQIAGLYVITRGGYTAGAPDPNGTEGVLFAVDGEIKHTSPSGAAGDLRASKIYASGDAIETDQLQTRIDKRLLAMPQRALFAQDHADIADYIPEEGAAFTPLTDVWSTSGGAAQAPVGDSITAAVIDNPNGTFWETVLNTGNGGIVFRVQDSLNFWLFGVDSANAFITEVVAGSPTTHVTRIHGGALPLRLTLMDDGENIVGTVPSVSEVLTYTSTDGAGRMGVGIGKAGAPGAAAWDWFVARTGGVRGYVSPPELISQPSDLVFEVDTPVSYDYAQHYVGAELSYSINTPALEPFFDTETGILSGTFTELGGFLGVEVTATNDNGSATTDPHSITIAEAPALTGAVVENASPSQIDLTFSQVMTGTVAGWAARINTVPVTGLALVGAGATRDLSFNETVKALDTADYSYSEAAGDMQGDSLPLGDIALTPAVNNVLPVWLSQPADFDWAVDQPITPYDLSAHLDDSGYTYTVAGGAWPAGVTMNAAGLLTGTPTALGNGSATVRATGAGKSADSAPILWDVVAAPSLISAAVQNAAPSDIELTFDQVMTGTVAGWSATINAVPATGLTLSGTGTTRTLGMNETVRAQDVVLVSYDAGTGDMAGPEQPLPSITDDPVTNNVLPVWQTQPGAFSWTLNVPITPYEMSQHLDDIGYTYDLETGAWPAGVSMSSAGTVTGTPTAEGSGSVTVRATGAGKSASSNPTGWSVADLPVLVSAVVENATPSQLDLTFSEPMTNTDASGWSVTINAVPATGLIMTGTGTTRALNINETVAPLDTVLVSYDEASGNMQGVSFPLGDITDFAVTNNLLPIFSGPTSDQEGTEGQAFSHDYSQYFTGATSYSWSDNVPGLSINPGTGVVSGTPTTPGTVPIVTVTGSNAAGDTDTNDHEYNILNAPPVFSGPVADRDLPVGQAASHEYAQYFTGNSLTYSENQSIPGMTLNPSTGQLSGTPTTPGTTAGYIVTATNDGGSDQTNGHDITVLNAPPVFSGPVPEQQFPVNQAGSHDYSQYFTGSGITYSENQSIPGMTLNTSTGELSGTPTTPGTTSGYIVTATNNGGSDQTNGHNVVILEAPPTFIGGPVTQRDYDEGVFGSYDYAQHFTGNNLAYSENDAVAGMDLDGVSGLHSGTPTAAGTTPYQVTATNNGGSAQTNLHDVVVSGGGGPTLVHQSTFTGANGTTIEAYVPEVGSQWTNVDSQAWEIDGNAMRLASGGGAISHPNSAADQEIRFTCLRQASGSATQNIDARTVDSQNGWFLQILATACRLRDEVGNVPTTRITVNWQRGTRLTWNMNGDLHTLTSTTASDTFTSTLYQTQVSDVRYVDSTPDSARGLDELEVSTL